MVSVKKPLPNIFQQYSKVSKSVLQQPIPLAAKQYTKTKCLNWNWHTNLQSNKDKGKIRISIIICKAKFISYLSGDQFCILFFFFFDDTHTSRNLKLANNIVDGEEKTGGERKENKCQKSPSVVCLTAHQMQCIRSCQYTHCTGFKSEIDCPHLT